MKVLNCVPDIQNYNGGPTVCIFNILNLMNNKNYEVNLMCEDKIGLASNNKFIIHKVRKSPLEIIEIFKLINRYDVIHVHSFWSLFVLQIIFVSITINKKIILTPHGMLTKKACSNKKLKFFLAPLIRILLSKISLFHFLTKNELHETIQYLKKNNIKNFIIQSNWINPKEKFISSKKKIFEKDIFNLVFLGRIHPVKNLSLQIELINKLNSKNIKSRLYLVGPIQDRDYYQDLVRKINKLKINDFIYFIGPIYDQSKFEYISQADICLLTSKFECNSMSALEVMKVGGILVATKSCSLSEANKFGAIKEVNSELDDLFITVSQILLSDKKIKSTLRNNAKSYVENFSSEKSALRTFKKMYFGL